MSGGRSSASATFGLALLGALVVVFGWYCASHSIDFPLYHRAGLQILRGDYELYPTDVYAGAVAPRHGFRYAPIIAFLFVPLAVLPLPVAAFVFFLLKAAAFVATFVMIGPFVGVRDRVGQLMLVALLVTGGYVVEEFRNGNAHSLVIWLMVVAFARAEQGELAIPGSALAVAVATKITPVALLAYYGFRRAVALCIITVVILAGIWLIPSALWGFDTTRHLTEGFVKYALLKADEPLPARNYSLRGALIKLGSGSLSPAVISGISIAAAAAAAFAILWVVSTGREHPGRRALELALILTAMTLFAPQTQRIHFSALAVPAAILWALTRSQADLPFRRLAITALWVNAIAGTLLPVLLPSRRLSRAYIDFSPYTFAALLLFVALLATAVGLNFSLRGSPSYAGHVARE